MPLGAHPLANRSSWAGGGARCGQQGLHLVAQGVSFILLVIGLVDIC